ncbi:MAG: hypothetical protein PHN41_03230 [Bacteroidales bacterium]|jgi:hypothetical protein|nr:hypothetical protein [Bacteroidales bacterium]MDD4703683.1 hypothetical protein [Bacteroidales bacterium]MDX9798380.1 hypothetical protein [Bacteroidales bacterium]
MNKKSTLYIVTIVSLSFLIFSCNKKEDNNIKITKYDVKETYYMPEIFGLSGYNIKDTVNEIYGGLLFPISRTKTNEINVSPIEKSIGSQMQSFVDEIKERNSKKKVEGKNFIEIRPTYFILYDDHIYSCLIKKTTCFANEDTIKDYYTLLYDYREEAILGFDDIFSIGDTNFKSFISLFPNEMSIKSLADLKKTDFNIETDSIAFNVNKNKADNQILKNQFKQSIEVLRPFFKNKNQFIKSKK